MNTTLKLEFSLLFLWRFFGCRFQFRIADTRVVDGLQFGFEHLFCRLDVKEGDGALVEVSLPNLSVNNLVHQGADAFFCVRRQAS